jgi:hypothetical protein
MPGRRREPRDPFASPTPKRLPFDFVLDELDALAPETKPMFGCTAVYVGAKIVFILRKRGQPARDDGVWIATTHEHHESLRAELPSLRGIELFGGSSVGWRVLPADADDFEASVLHACALVRRGDARIGKVPKPRRSKRAGVKRRTRKKGA